ncbi:MAG: hypothetical protein ACI4A3_03095 [Lachnospiraceae bacterium]
MEMLLSTVYSILLNCQLESANIEVYLTGEDFAGQAKDRWGTITIEIRGYTGYGLDEKNDYEINRPD